MNGSREALIFMEKFKQMKKIMIVGAGGHGKVVAEIAQDCGYGQIAFLDDNSTEAIGKVNELERFVQLYPEAFVAIGNNEVRGNILTLLKNAGYEIPTLIHPTAYISKTAKIGSGTVVEPKAIVNTNAKIEEGCIISVGAIVDHDTQVGCCVHVNAGAVVKAGTSMKAYQRLDAGMVWSDTEC